VRARRELEYQRDKALRRAEAAERQVGALEGALDALSLGVVVLDADWRECFRNRRATTPTGDLASDALVRGALAQLVEARAAGAQVVDLHGPPARTIELRLETLAGGGAVAVVEDATDRARLNDVRRDFVANVGHELRTPIGALAVLAEAAQGETDPGTISRLLGRMPAEVARAQSLIEDLLELSRIEQQTEAPAESVDIADVVDQAVERVRALAERSGVVVDVGPVEGGRVLGHRDELVSAVANLIDNAVKYSELGGPVSVSAASAASEGGWVEVAVRDGGVGIPAKDLDRIFERFYRVDPARDRRTGGSGLGLAIVRHVVANHGGEVVVESVEGVGSTFTLRLPEAR
jgi:two-component system sensor histidine kinase SenX3